ncbi:MAG: YeeE/YedE family protein [Gemmatimonadaceae bacterium]|nr:YeeE/YedE family protein [Gemmatimonadaceae bacterium]
MPLFYGLLVGVAMGWILQRARASSPAMIAKALRLEDLTIIKFMALTIAVGMVLTAGLALVAPMHFDIKPTYAVGVLVGGLVFGVGFALGGYCPGTCIVGAAEGRRDAVVTIIGGLFGALVFTLTFDALKPILITPLDFGRITLPELLHLPRLLVAVVVGAVFVAVVRWLPTVRRVG